MNQEPQARKNKVLLIKLSLGVLFMFGFAYMLVPLYSLVCKQWGINGKADTAVAQAPKNLTVDAERTIEVGFSTTVHGKMSFIFKPLERKVHIHPGETKLVYFFAQNNVGHDITVQAIPSITPDVAAKYLKKTQCFCFTQQYFYAGEKADMPVYFYVDPKLPKNIKEITLSYTLFDATQYKKKGPHFTQGRIHL
ncbi:MAG: cytochrome c oxidase assembly protein [Gammaproteobacteria bacterium]